MLDQRSAGLLEEAFICAGRNEAGAAPQLFGALDVIFDEPRPRPKLTGQLPRLIEIGPFLEDMTLSLEAGDAVVTDIPVEVVYREAL